MKLVPSLHMLGVLEARNDRLYHRFNPEHPLYANAMEIRGGHETAIIDTDSDVIHTDE